MPNKEEQGIHNRPRSTVSNAFPLIIFYNGFFPNFNLVYSISILNKHSQHHYIVVLETLMSLNKTNITVLFHCEKMHHQKHPRILELAKILSIYCTDNIQSNECQLHIYVSKLFIHDIVACSLCNAFLKKVIHCSEETTSLHALDKHGYE